MLRGVLAVSCWGLSPPQACPPPPFFLLDRHPPVLRSSTPLSLCSCRERIYCCMRVYSSVQTTKQSSSDRSKYCCCMYPFFGHRQQSAASILFGSWPWSASQSVESCPVCFVPRLLPSTSTLRSPLPHQTLHLCYLASLPSTSSIGCSPPSPSTLSFFMIEGRSK